MNSPEKAPQNLSCNVEMTANRVTNNQHNVSQLNLSQMVSQQRHGESPLREDQQMVRNHHHNPHQQQIGPVRQLNQIGSHRIMLEGGSLLNINPTTNLTGVMSTGENSVDLMTTIDGD